jgi:hypothetical protein
MMKRIYSASDASAIVGPLCGKARRGEALSGTERDMAFKVAEGLGIPAAPLKGDLMRLCDRVEEAIQKQRQGRPSRVEMGVPLFSDLPPEMRLYMLANLVERNVPLLWDMCQGSQDIQEFCKSVTLPFLRNRSSPDAGLSDKITLYEFARNAVRLGATTKAELERGVLKCLLYGWMEWCLGYGRERLALKMLSAPDSFLLKWSASWPPSPLGREEEGDFVSFFEVVLGVAKKLGRASVVPLRELRYEGLDLDLFLSWTLLDGVTLRCLQRYGEEKVYFKNRFWDLVRQIGGNSMLKPPSWPVERLGLLGEPVVALHGNRYDALRQGGRLWRTGGYIVKYEPNLVCVAVLDGEGRAHAGGGGGREGGGGPPPRGSVGASSRSAPGR